ncbi:uncharacterized protein BCR38DRAFT_413727 [Pseudomassariella vexata]|uniref:Uncharacterized protein n=1 Tax=Pseudomassariella vexata TaxID=1141098 RepID=A0A1Y2DEZ4_9PEZI|nr:uncharacterized protein BCR38DRAFT_413727 [Pseudomassariella vexata]ORY57819.1 hypothetical protein BCR38DRAFT_413727 [Pseudomassariella vexata]
MDSPSNRGRGRGGGRKRHTFPSRSSFRSSESFESPSAAATTPVAVPQTSSSFTFETPSPNARGTRMRTRHQDDAQPSPDEPGSKGGRSLRKRARIDYTSFDQADDEEAVEAKSTPLTTRSVKKRKADPTLHDEDFKEELETRIKRRASEQPQKSTTRRSTARKSTVEPQPPVTEQQEEDVTVHDTIEVGGHHSEPSESSFHHSNQSTSSGASPKNESTANASAPTSTSVPTQITAPEPTAETARKDLQHRKPQPQLETPPEPEVETKEQEIPKVEVHEEPQQLPAELPTAPEKTKAEEAIHGTQTKFAINQVNPLDAAQEAIEPATEQDKVQPSNVILKPNRLLPSSAIFKQSKFPPPTKAVEQDDVGTYAYLTPYIQGARVFYPASQTEVEPEAEPEAVQEEAVPEETVEDQPDVGDEDTPGGTPGGAEDTAVNSPLLDVDVPSVQPCTKKQFAFKQTRSASQFTDLFENPDSLSQSELWERLAAVNRVLVAWQDEYNELRKITDDEDNAQRYQTEEAHFSHKQKMLLSKDPTTNPIRTKDFVVKGIRAAKPDPMVTYARQQDRIMANAYLFDYDDRESKIGLQDPVGQRGGAHKTRLRDRPKQTAKAAEADDVNVVHGKRPRKAPNLFGDSEAVSRSSTPVPVPQPRRRRGRPSAADKEREKEEAEEQHLDVLPTSQPEPVVEETPKKRKGGRPRKHPLPPPIPEDDLPTPPAPESVEAEEERPSRKRRRRNAPVQEEPALPATNGTNGHALAGPTTRRRNSRLAEIPSGSFYSTASVPSTQPHDESRPNTSSSTATESTTGTYQLREKRQKRFSLGEDEDDFEDEMEQRKPKRVRRTSKKTQVEDFAPVPHTYAPIEPEPQRLPKIKIKNFMPGNGTAFPPGPGPAPTSAPGAMPVSYSINFSQSNSSTPPQLAPSQSNGMESQNGSQNGFSENGYENKDYSTMTKSEKMSYSMKARWASGSMSPAVAKRRATLAAKKAAAKPATAGVVADTPEMSDVQEGSQGPNGRDRVEVPDGAVSQ